MITKQDFYYEICIIPNALNELFASRIQELTNEALEFSKDSIIIRTSQNIYNNLIADLNAYSEALSQINNIKISFSSNLAKKQNRDWILEYKNSIKPIKCGNISIIPTWLNNASKLDFGKNLADSIQINKSSTNLALKSQPINIFLEPSFAFGSGHHCTTFMCLFALQTLDLNKKSLLDFGCGSGILALCAQKMGANVDICDIDSDCIEESKKNFRKNNAIISSIFHPQFCGGKKYEIIISNIVTDILCEHSEILINNLASDGILILSGILNELKDRIYAYFAPLEVVLECSCDEWSCIMFKKHKESL